MSGVGAYSTGYPIPVYYGTNPNSFVFNGGLRPNLSGDPILVSNNGFDPNVNSFLNRTAFAAPASADLRQRAGVSEHAPAEFQVGVLRCL